MAFSMGHRFEGITSVPFTELENEDYLSRVHCEHPQHLDLLGVPRAYESNVRFRSEREDWIQAMICAGMGCAVMPEFLPLMPGIATRVLEEPEVSRTISLVTVAGRRFSPAAQVFVRYAQRFGARETPDKSART